MSKPMRSEVITLACRDASGAPCVIPVAVQATEEDRRQGIHYERAEEIARERDYEGPFVHFDSDELPTLISGVDEAVSMAAEQAKAPAIYGALVTHDHRHAGMAEASLEFATSPITTNTLQLSDPGLFEAHREDEDVACDELPAPLQAAVNYVARRAAVGHKGSEVALERLLASGGGCDIKPPAQAFEELWAGAHPEDRLIVSGGLTLVAGGVDELQIEGERAVSLDGGCRFAVEVTQDVRTPAGRDHLMVSAEECDFEMRQAQEEQRPQRRGPGAG